MIDCDFQPAADGWLRCTRCNYGVREPIRRRCRPSQADANTLPAEIHLIVDAAAGECDALSGAYVLVLVGLDVDRACYRYTFPQPVCGVTSWNVRLELCGPLAGSAALHLNGIDPESEPAAVLADWQAGKTLGEPSVESTCDEIRLPGGAGVFSATVALGTALR
jgi:hypothetical protein